MEVATVGRGQLSDPAGRHFAPVLNLKSAIESVGEHDFTCPACDEILLRCVDIGALREFRVPQDQVAYYFGSARD